MQSIQKTPLWQRALCGLLCIAGLVALPFNAVHEVHRGWSQLWPMLLGAYGLYLFGHIALLGKLPGKVSGTRYIRFHRKTKRHKP